MRSRVLWVDTLDIDARATQWSRHVEWLDAWIARAASVPPPTGSTHVDWAHIVRSARQLRDELADHARALATAAHTYDEAEWQVNAICQRAADVGWWLVGRFSPSILIAGGVTAALAMGSVKFIRVALNEIAPQLRPDFDQALSRAFAQTLSSPILVRVVELGVGSLDEALAGAAGFPLPVALAAGTAGLGITTTAGTARLASRINEIVARPEDALPASAGEGTSVATRIERTESSSARAPRDIAEAFQRIPTDADAGAQVRIEQYDRNFVVYIGGTVDGALGAGSQPWDMSSNLAALGGDQSASELAVRKAMSEAGVSAADSVILVGHSQGGLLAMRLAQDESLPTAAVITAGAPIHQINAADGIPVIAVEHSDDIVPALGGPIPLTAGTSSSGACGSGTLYVRHNATAGVGVTGDELLPAHNISRYVETARDLNTLPDAQLDCVRNVFAGLAPQGTSTLWRAQRVSD